MRWHHLGGGEVEYGRGDVVSFLTLFLREQGVVILVVDPLVQPSAIFSMPREGLVPSQFPNSVWEPEDT